MKFEELDKGSQDGFIHLVESEIFKFLDKKGIKEYTMPTIQEYIDFFNKYDEEYEFNEYESIESIVESRYLKMMKISFDYETKKVVLNVYDNDIDYDLYDDDYDYDDDMF